MEAARIAACVLLCLDTVLAAIQEPGLGEVVQVLDLPPREVEGTTEEYKVETKRAALLLDKIMFAVQKALDEKEKSGKKSGGGSGSTTSTAADMDLVSFAGSGLERRGNNHD